MQRGRDSPVSSRRSAGAFMPHPQCARHRHIRRHRRDDELLDHDVPRRCASGGRRGRGSTGYSVMASAESPRAVASPPLGNELNRAAYRERCCCCQSKEAAAARERARRQFVSLSAIVAPSWSRRYRADFRWACVAASFISRRAGDGGPPCGCGRGRALHQVPSRGRVPARRSARLRMRTLSKAITRVRCHRAGHLPCAADRHAHRQPARQKADAGRQGRRSGRAGSASSRLALSV